VIPEKWSVEAIIAMLVGTCPSYQISLTGGLLLLVLLRTRWQAVWLLVFLRNLHLQVVAVMAVEVTLSTAQPACEFLMATNKKCCDRNEATHSL